MAILWERWDPPRRLSVFCAAVQTGNCGGRRLTVTHGAAPPASASHHLGACSKFRFSELSSDPLSQNLHFNRIPTDPITKHGPKGMGEQSPYTNIHLHAHTHVEIYVYNKHIF